MNNPAAAFRYSKTSPLVTLTAAIGFVVTGLLPAFSDGLALQDTAVGSADGAIETIANWGSAEGAVFQAAAVDLNGDTQPEWIVRVDHMYQCRGAPKACRTYVMHRTANRTWEGIAYPYSRAVDVLPSLTNGFHDLAFDGVTYSYDGSDYREGRSPAAEASAEPSAPAPSAPPAEDDIAAGAPPAGWQPITFHGYVAQAPAGWQIVEESNDQVMLFTGDMQARLGAMFALAYATEDEILPLDANISVERAVTLAGRPFVWRELTTHEIDPEHGAEIILLASKSPVESDEYLLVIGMTNGVAMSDYRAVFEQVFATVQFGRPDAPTPEPEATGEALPAPKPPSPGGAAPTPNKRGSKLGNKVPQAGSLTPAPQPQAGGAAPAPQPPAAPVPQPAAQGTAVDVEGVTFILPDGWTAGSDNPGNKVFTSPDGRWTLLSFWWFPDEPLLGYDDITKVENMIIDHEPVTRIHVTMLGRVSIQNVTERARDDGDRFIFTIEGEGAGPAEVQAMHDRLVANLHLQGGFDPSLRVDPVSAAAPQPVPAPAPETAPVAPPAAAEPSAAATSGLEILDVPAAPPPELDIFAAPTPELSWTTYVNPRFGLRLDVPQGLFLPTPPPENGDGQAFVANDQASRFSVWGSFNVLEATAQGAMDSFAASLAPGAVRSSRTTGAGGFETVALRDGKLVFHAEIVTPEVIFGFEAELDNPDDTAMADVFGAMMESLRGPDASAAAASPVATPPGQAQPDPLTDGVVAASLAEIEPALGQTVALRVETLRRVGDWAYLSGVPTRPDGRPLDWLSTPFARVWQADAMSDLVMVLLVKQNGSWRVVDQIIGPTDVYWLSWVAQYGLPETLFYAP